MNLTYAAYPIHRKIFGIRWMAQMSGVGSIGLSTTRTAYWLRAALQGTKRPTLHRECSLVGPCLASTIWSRRVRSRVLCMWLWEMATAMQAIMTTVAQTRTLMIESTCDLSDFVVQ